MRTEKLYTAGGLVVHETPGDGFTVRTTYTADEALALAAGLLECVDRLNAAREAELDTRERVQRFVRENL